MPAETTTYSAAAYSSGTRVPNADGSPRATLAEASRDVDLLPRAWHYGLRAIDATGGDRALTAGEWARLHVEMDRLGVARG